MARRRLKKNQRRGMTRRAKGAKKPMSAEQKAEQKKKKEAQREASKKSN